MTITSTQRATVRWHLLDGLSVASIERRTGYSRDIIERVRGEDRQRVRIGGRYGYAVHPETLRVVPTIPAEILADEARRTDARRVAHRYSVPENVVANIVQRLCK